MACFIREQKNFQRFSEFSLWIGSHRAKLRNDGAQMNFHHRNFDKWIADLHDLIRISYPCGTSSVPVCSIYPNPWSECLPLSYLREVDAP